MAEHLPTAPQPSGVNQSQPMFLEIGVAGLKQASGYLYEEYLPQLRGLQGVRTFQEMSQNDAIIGAVLNAFGLMIRAVDWKITPANDTPEAQAEAEFVDSLFDDMSHPFSDVVAEACSMLVYGWSYHEIVLKLRNGPKQQDPSQRSKYDDGRVGIRKLAVRGQDTLLRWEFDPLTYELKGLNQLPPTGGYIRFIPIERALLFRTISRKDSPEGLSMLRNAYRSWYFKKTIEEKEAIGIERDLVGLPVVSIPSRYFTSKKPEDMAVLANYIKVARDLKFNEQAGIVKPSDPYTNADGTISQMEQVTIELMSASGSKPFDTDKVVQRLNQNIATSCLASFLTLGQAGTSGARGSYGMHQSMSELFLRASESLIEQIASPINRYLLPRIWAYNNLDPDLMPKAQPGDINPVDLTELAQYITSLAGAGMPLFPDDMLEAHMRDIGGLPQKAATDTL